MREKSVSMMLRFIVQKYC